MLALANKTEKWQKIVFFSLCSPQLKHFILRKKSWFLTRVFELSHYYAFCIIYKIRRAGILRATMCIIFSRVSQMYAHVLTSTATSYVHKYIYIIMYIQVINVDVYRKINEEYWIMNFIEAKLARLSLWYFI